MKNNHKGFTLLELIVVIAIFAGMTAITIPYMTPWLARADYRDASQQLLQVLQKARSLSISENRQYQVEIDVANDDTYTFQLSQGNRASNSIYTPFSTWDWNGTNLSTSVALRGGAACNSTADVTFNFNPNGSSNVDNNYICVLDAKDIAAGQKFRVGIANRATARVAID